MQQQGKKLIPVVFLESLSSQDEPLALCKGSDNPPAQLLAVIGNWGLGDVGYIVKCF